MVYPDLQDFVAALNDHDVRYLIIGGYAVAFHARPRLTKDIDFFIAPTDANARRVLAAIQSFWGTTPPNLTVADLTDEKTVVQLGRAPVRVDLLSGVKGASFAPAWKRRVEAMFGSVAAHYIALDDLIATKIAAGRKQDLADLESLRRAQQRRR